MDSNSQKYDETLFKAMEILIDKKIEQVSFDTTIEATITNADRASEGIYTVSNGSSLFSAYSTETEYKVNDAVMVTIPQGDYSKQKIIIGKQPDETGPMVYRSPFQNLVNISSNIIGESSEVAIWANSGDEYGWNENVLNFEDSKAYSNTIEINGEEQKTALLWDSDLAFEGNTFVEVGHTQIGLKAQFSTWLNEYATAYGNYGLAMVITFTAKDFVYDEDNRELWSFSKIITFDSDEFIGDVYNFETYYTQEKVYDISEYIDFPITKIQLYAYQRNNFKDLNEEEIYSSEDINGEEGFSSIPANIFIKDPYICLGISAETFSEDFATIVTKSDESYTAEFPVIPILEETEDIKLDENGLIKASSRRKNEFFKLLNKICISKKGYYKHSRIIDLFNALTLLETIDQGKTIPDEDGLVAKINKSAKEHLIIKSKNNDIDDTSILLKDNNNNKYQIVLKEVYYKSGQFQNGEKIIFSKEDILLDLLKESNLSFNNKKEIILRWVHKNKKTETIQAVQDALPKDYHVFWYVYKIGAPSPDNLIGANWERFYGCIDTPNTSEEIEEEKQLKLINEKGSYLVKQEYDNATDTVNVEFYPNTLREKELICAVVAKQEGVIDSLGSDDFTYRFITKTQPIEFVNKTDVILRRASEQAQIDFNALSIKFGDEEKGNYFLYNRAKQVYDKENEEIRFLSAVFDKDVNDVNNKPLLKNFNSIKWIIPASNSMIIPYTSTQEDRKSLKSVFSQNTEQFPVYRSGILPIEIEEEEENIENQDVLYTINKENNKENDYYIFEQKNNQEEKFNDNEILNQICFSIEKNLDYQKNRNTVYLEADIDNQLYTAQVNLLFGTAGSSGSDYTIVIDWDESKGVFDINKDSISGKAKLFDKTGKEVILDDNAKFEYSWSQAKCDSNENQPISETIKEEKDLCYPVCNGALEKLSYIPYGGRDTGLPVAYFANWGGNPELFWKSISENKYQLIYPLYKYDLNEKEFKEAYKVDGTIYEKEQHDKINSLLLYAKTIPSGPSVIPKKKIFKKIDNVKTGTVEDSEGKICQGVIQINKDKTTTYYYHDKKKAFIKYNDIYIIDPYDQYYENLEYYYPEEALEKIYINTTLTVKEKDNNNSNFIIEKNSENDKISMEDLYILQVKLTNFGNYDLIANFPIPLKNQQDNFIIDGIEGLSEIRYTTSGEVDYNPSPYIIKFRQKNDSGEWQSKSSKDEKIGCWKLICETNKDISFPTLIEMDKNILNNEEDTYYLPSIQPPAIYFKETPLYGMSFILNEDSNVDKKILWTQPILVYQDNYPSTTLNQWSGQQKIITDTDKGLIVANGFSAGKKENDNTFTGVVIGDWSKDDADSMITKQTGIYGFNHGKMSYALKDDGTAFFGQDGKGRIYLNGNNARIYSANWITSSLKNKNSNTNCYQQNQEGMMLDIDDGKLLVQKTVDYAVQYDREVTFTYHTSAVPQSITATVYTNKIDNTEIYYCKSGQNNLYFKKNKDTGQYEKITSSIDLEKDYSKQTQDSDDEREHFIDHRKIEISPNNFIISRTRYEQEERTNILELKINERDPDKMEYALRSIDYTPHTSSLSGKGKGLEINLKNHVIREYESSIGNSTYKFKLQVGGEMKLSSFSGYKFVLDCNESDILRIGTHVDSAIPVEKDDTNFIVNTGGGVTCTSITSKNPYLSLYKGALKITTGHTFFNSDTGAGNDLALYTNGHGINCGKIYSNEIRIYDSSDSNKLGGLECSNIKCSGINCNNNITCNGINCNNNITCNGINCNNNITCNGINCSSITFNSDQITKFYVTFKDNELVWSTTKPSGSKSFEVLGIP